MALQTAEIHTIVWKTEAFKLVLAYSSASPVRLHSISIDDDSVIDDPGSASPHVHDLPLTSIRFAGEGNTSVKTSKSLIGSYASERLRYRTHSIRSRQNGEELIVKSQDPRSGCIVNVHFVAFDDTPIFQTFTEVLNTSQSKPLIVKQLSSLTIGGLTGSSKTWWDEYTLLTANNGWFREVQWREQSLPEVGIDDNKILKSDESHAGSQAIYGLSNRGSFSTGSHLPMGILKRKDDKVSWIWQVEHNGSWRWEIGDFKDSTYLAAGGPTSVDHDCKVKLGPGEKFTSVPVAFGRVPGGVDSAFGALTTYRQSIRRPHSDNENMPIIFNDYMNCLMGDPDEDKIKALIDPVARSGAEYFVIDAGWYADDSNWWDDVGLWKPSQKRFPSGFKTLLDTIKTAGLTTGLWLEPEVVGVRSVVAKNLPDEAFFQDCGERVLERGRYQLDFRHPKVIEWMDSVIERLVTGYGVGYFKFDYNIEVVSGTDVDTSSAGAAHLEHNRAYLAWVTHLLERYPNLVIENCSSGAQRMDYAMLAVHPIQSTSDQQDPLLYAAIAAAAPTAVTPEQSATWTYPQRDWDDETNALTVVNSLLGRVHLSGRLDQLSPAQYDLVQEGMNVYRCIRCDLRTCLPVWPLGLPKWHDEWVCLGMVSESQGKVYLSVWRRGGNTNLTIPVELLRKRRNVQVSVLYPAQFETEYSWDDGSGLLHVELPDKPCARLFELRYEKKALETTA